MRQANAIMRQVNAIMRQVLTRIRFPGSDVLLLRFSLNIFISVAHGIFLKSTFGEHFPIVIYLRSFNVFFRVWRYVRFNFRLSQYLLINFLMSIFILLFSLDLLIRLSG